MPVIKPRSIRIFTFYLSFSIAVSWVLYILIGHHIIATLYNSPSTGFFAEIMKSRGVIPLQYYYQQADRIMVVGTFSIVISFIIFILIFRKFSEIFVVCCSFLFCFSVLFIIFEIFQNFPKLLHLDAIDYYAYKINYMADEKLVYREKPLVNARIKNFRGTLYSPIYGIDIEPVAIDWSTDHNGFRNSIPINVADAVVIGDSYIEYGDSESDTFVKRLEAKLPRLTVMNLGKAGYGPIQYLEVFKRYGINKRPRYALFCFFEGNDLRDTKNYIEWARNPYVKNDYGKIYTALTGSFLQRYFMALNGTVNIIKKAITLLLNLCLEQIWQIRGYTHPNIAVINIGNNTSKMLFGFKDSRLKDELEQSEELQELREVFLEFKRVSDENNILPIIIYIPSQIHVYADYTTPESGVNWLSQRSRQIRAKENIERIAIDLARELSLDFINLSHNFEASTKDGKIFYYALDPHWNTEGREAAAEVVSTIIKAKLVQR